jgi:hypothetical protein
LGRWVHRTLTSIHPDNFEKCDFTIDIYSWDEIYFRGSGIVDPDLNPYKFDKSLIEKILNKGLSQDSSLCINKHSDCTISDDKIRQWAEKMGIVNIIIRPLPLYLEHEDHPDIKRLQPLAL